TTRYYAISISAILIILLNLKLSYMGLSPCIDIASIVFVAIAIAISKLLNEKSQSSFLLGIGLILIALAALGIFATVQDMSKLGGAIAVAILPMVYLCVYIFFVLNTKQILLADSVAYKGEGLELSKYDYIFHIGFIVLIFLAIVMSQAGFGAAIDVPSLLMFLPLLATIKLEDKIKGLLLRLNIVLGVATINLLIGIYSVLLDPSSENIGPMFALMILSSTYALYIYLGWIKPQLSKTTINYTKSEYMLYIVSAFSIFLPFIYIVLSK
ncbi:MAG: hypothetical protein U9R37_04695, partial [Campylobacterota bacterium]|nr:hypothetical protein [Campylobacterota bacterium]